MDVFLVPVGVVRYKLYCEPGELDQQGSGLAGRVLRRFRDVAAAEKEARRDRRASAGRARIFR